MDPICRCIFNVLSYIKFTLALQNCPKTKTQNMETPTRV
ncbi:hypothetical protein LEP1GSC016_1411 [Leptospira borgpetersenii serovar Hardjo-bovis str. Sponselee]|uniref:Uncharacterized protein n=2 Tax=Leptospira borgpetersenii TaxID=174 RepID=M6BLE1_LEPBO|nr:hypothetical protein LEP1GSC016_1411 [Leptospira borgpetersenii serovar Hardjo-bovis str. Sponselee]EMO63109.1 hypothetical protein LEP1GSC133_3469 [Leptospira borgpetersenii serovar Pomona str. 200901868]